jgi:hypothetical protein
MKANRFLCFLLVLFMSNVNCHAQQLKFLGIPLCSDLSQYCDVLKAKRFKDKYPSELLLMSAGRMATFGRYQDVMSNCLRLQRMMRV